MKQKISATALMELLKAQYPHRCTKTAPFAFWKMRGITKKGKAFFLPEGDCRYVIYRKHLLYYSAEDGRCHLRANELNGLKAISLPAPIYEQIKEELLGFHADYGWILRYNKAYVPPSADFSDYEAVNFDFGSKEHYTRAAQIISGGEDSWMTPPRIRRMTKFTAFDPSLWIFIKERKSGKLIAVGISAYSPAVRETDLDWIYVLPEYQGKGAGRFLIRELIRRCGDKSDIIRVSGEEAFYRRCGFIDDTLWVWATKPGYGFKCGSIQP